jgi:hypothetical protein
MLGTADRGHPRPIPTLDYDRKVLDRFAPSTFKSADILARRSGFDAGQPHGLAALGASENSDFCTAE